MPRRLTLLLVLGLFCNSAGAATPGVTVQRVKGGYDDVKERIVMAIENRGLVLNFTARVGEMLERTGKDIGSPSQVYARAEVLEFCSAALSRKSMQADPHNIVFCPYAIAIYMLPGETDGVYIAYRKPPAQGPGPASRSLREVGQLLDAIVREALKP